MARSRRSEPPAIAAGLKCSAARCKRDRIVLKPAHGKKLSCPPALLRGRPALLRPQQPSRPPRRPPLAPRAQPRASSYTHTYTPQIANYRKDIAELLRTGKQDYARIRVEAVIRESLTLQVRRRAAAARARGRSSLGSLG